MDQSSLVLYKHMQVMSITSIAEADTDIDDIMDSEHFHKIS